MNNLDKQYKDILSEIIHKGSIKKNDSDDETFSIFGKQIIHNMEDGFPLLTTKKINFKDSLIELLWFMRGESNINYLIENKCTLWDEKLFNNYLEKIKDLPIEFTSESKEITLEGFLVKLKNDEIFNQIFGDLGPIYSKQWRKWNKYSITQTIVNKNGIDTLQDNFELKQIDQLFDLITKLRLSTDEKINMVNSWNVGDLEDMIYPINHYNFQVYSRKLNLDERIKLYKKQNDIFDSENTKEINHDFLNEKNIHERELSLLWNVNSINVFSELPHNISIYGFLLSILAEATGMIPGKLIGNFGIMYLQNKDVEEAKNEIDKQTHDLCELKIDSEEWDYYFDDIDELNTFINSIEVNHFEIKNYLHN